MKKNIVILIIFLLPFYLFSQSGNFLNNKPQIPVFNENYYKNNLLLKDTTVKKNIFSIETDIITDVDMITEGALAYIPVSVAYARRIKKTIFVGIGTGNFYSRDCGSYTFINFTDLWRENIHLECFVIFLSHTQHLMLETGIRASVKMWEEEEGMGTFLGCYFKPMFGWQYFKIGPLIEISPISFPILYNTLLIRCNFTF